MRELLSVEVAIIIAHNLRKARKKANLTQEEVAERAGVNRVSYAKYETGKINVGIQNLIKIAYVLNVTVDDLLFGVLEAMQEERDY